MVMIGKAKARKQRNAAVITIPAKLGIKVGQKFYIIKDDDTLRLIPETEDFFEKLAELDVNHVLDEFSRKYTP